MRFGWYGCAWGCGKIGVAGRIMQVHLDHLGGALMGAGGWELGEKDRLVTMTSQEIGKSFVSGDR